MARLADTLDGLRRRSFVGRDAEIALFRAAMAGPGVLFVHGVGGVGKTWLLNRFAEIAAELGRVPVRIDARHLAPGALPGLSGVPSPVLFLDTYELLEPLDDWIREHYLPSLPADCLVVIAGRRAPRPPWRADPAWRELTRVVPLGRLSADDGAGYLAAQNVAAALQPRLLSIAHGHPLTLALLTDAVRRGVTPRGLNDVPDVVGALVTRLLAEAPSARHRIALEACALVPATTENYLRSMLGDDAGELFAWLRAQSFVDEGPYGLFPHDIVRDVLDADLRWRDPQRHADNYRRKLAAFQDQVRAVTGRREQLELVARMVVLNGARSRLTALNALPPTFGAYVDDLRHDDQGPIAAMTAAWQGREQARLVAYWMNRRPEAFHIFRDADQELRGYAACLDLTEADLGADPGVDSMWRYAVKHGPPRSGERIRAWRFFLDRDQGQRPSPSMTLFVADQMLDILLLGADTAWSLAGAWEDADLWGPAMGFLDFWPADGAEYEVGPTSYAVFAHDWRRVDGTEWARALYDRQLGVSNDRASEEDGVPVLAEPEFADAVRAALRHLHDPDRLRTNPLLRSRILRQKAPDESGRMVALRELIEAGIGTLDPALADLMSRTFLRPTTTQARVAATLHLSFNTYRRHRDRAISRLTAWLWDHETGPARL
ncbi:ATP-binding protein [Actinoplanes sp. LDG1-06]|uniref:ATP-binding protein n=1 Tax=Paractinoplanes ovalisporus TaxID=2810368 RepID=A0ABS2AHS1_9ACTN|nr:ATP-binding protein [Actinoplanes ovalisporus]MBM2619360.1 ATP-binding protein [Actinoplanes ovalisporus]